MVCIELSTLYVNRASVVPVQSSIMTKNLVMTKNQYLSLESICIIDISMYLDLPARGTGKQMYRSSVERIIRGIDRRQTDGWTIENLI